MPQYVYNNNNTTWKVPWAIFTHLLFFILEVSLVRCAHLFNFWYINNSCVNTIHTHFPWSVLYVLHCSQSCVYSDETTWCPQWKMWHENLWKRNFRDSKFQNVPRCLRLNKLVPFGASSKAAYYSLSDCYLKTCWQPWLMNGPSDN